ncbi:MAG: flippase [Nitrospina sp.]|nr:flippase [Nitrospina sp.]MBT5632595.1 flippase [Nitrospina sp.]
MAARYLGSKGYGIFSFSFVAASIVLDFVDYGLRTYLTRELSRRPDDVQSLLTNIFIVKWFLTFLTMLVLFGVYSWLPLDRETLCVVVLIAIAMVLNGYSEIYLGVFRAFERMKLVSLLMVLQRIIFFVIGFWVLVLGGGIIEFSAIFLLASIINFFLARGYLKDQRGNFSANIDGLLIKNIFNESKYFCLAILFVWLYFRIDSVLIFLFLGKEETGLYFAAFKFIESLALILASIRAALFPAFSRAFLENPKQLNQIWERAVRFLFLIAIPISVATVTLAPQLIALLYGPDFKKSALLLQILAAPFLFLILNEFITYLLLAVNETKSVIKIAIAGALFSVIANILIIPRMGIMGSAIVAGLTELLVLFLFFRSIREVCGTTPFLSLLWKPALAAAAMGFILKQISWPLIPSILGGVGVYFLFLLLFRTFNENDFLVMKNIFNRVG